MDKNVLSNEIAHFCCYFNLLENPVDNKQIKENIKKQLDDVVFVENLYNTIFKKAKQYKILKRARIKALLIELEKIRIDLENKEFD